MSLIHWDPVRPSRMLDRHFGLALDDEDLLAPLSLSPWDRRLLGRPYNNWDISWPTITRDSGSVIHEDKDKFKVNVDVQHFKPEEIKVTSSGNTLTIEGKHEEQPDEHGYISRHFVRRYVLPEDHDLSRVQSNLSSDGVLTISAPKIITNDSGEKAIPIQQTGKPSRAIKNK